MNPSIVMTETISNAMPLVTIGIVVVGGLCLGLYHIATFKSYKQRNAQKH